MSKCDFCDKPSVGYTQLQQNLYCEDHEEYAESLSMDFWESIQELFYLDYSDEPEQQGDIDFWYSDEAEDGEF